MDFERLEQRTNRENLTQAGVENVVTDIVERATGKKSKHYSIREWYGQWLQLKEARSPATHARYKSTVDGFLAFLGSRADARLTLLSIDDVVDFRDAERTSGKAIGTVNTAVKHLRIAKISRRTCFLPRWFEISWMQHGVSLPIPKPGRPLHPMENGAE
jgi:hypothetical protein